MVFNFWKKSPVVLEQGEDVEVTFSPEIGVSEVEIVKVESQDKDSITLALPIKYRDDNPFRKNMALQVYVRRELMLGNFFTRIKDIENRDGQQLIHLHMPDSVRWVEVDSSNLPFRDFKRFEVEVPVEIGYSDDRFRGRTLDLSGGGAQVILKTYIPEDVVVDVRIALPDFAAFAKAKVRRSRRKKNDEDSKKEYVVALEFVEISEDAQNQIMHYCLKTLKKN